MKIKLLKVRHVSRSTFFYVASSNFVSKLAFLKRRPMDQGRKKFGLDMCLAWRRLA